MDISGNSLKNKKFEIDCRLDIRDTLSYQDSFNGIIIVKKAYNYEPEEYSHDLDTTDINLNGDEDGDEWDDYHGYYCEETRLCYRNGAQIYVDTDNLNDLYG